jgi:hypothetical protein
MISKIAAFIGLAGTLITLPAFGQAPSPTYAFNNGQWWDGTHYVRKTMYTANGRLQGAAPARVDETIDLAGRYVIPPLSEGHNHWLEAAQIDTYNACYLADGVYYVRDMGNIPFVLEQIRDKVNLPTSVDFRTAALGFTGPGAHPIEVIDYFVQAGIFPKDWKPDYDPQAELVVHTAKEVDEKFATLLRSNPDYVKVFLLFSEEYDKRLKDPAMRGNHRGMDPKLVSRIVKDAHAAGLKVAAHVYSVPDYRAALDAGVDEIAHLPGIAYEPQLGLDHYVLTPADAAKAKQLGVPVTTTIQGITSLPEEQPKYAALVRNQIIIPNLKLLKDAGVTILLGSDQFRHSSLNELFVLRDLGVFSNAELFKMITQTTTQAIFPERKLGRLDDGYEADFLVLDQDPLVNLDNLKSIHLRVKQGHRLSLPSPAMSRASLDCVGE